MEYRTDDGQIVHTGDRVFSHYTMTAGKIGEARSQEGWFAFTDDNGDREMLNGQRVCSLSHAQRMGWVPADVMLEVPGDVAEPLSCPQEATSAYTRAMASGDPTAMRLAASRIRLTPCGGHGKARQLADLASALESAADRGEDDSGADAYVSTFDARGASDPYVGSGAT